MNRRILTALLSACLISGACTFLLARRVRAAMSSAHHGVERYVAPVRPLQVGEVLSGGDLAWVEWPVDTPLRGAFKEMNAVQGRVVLYPLEKGSPIVERDLADPGTGGGLASRIPRGMRALALRSDDVVGVAGFLAPGSYVDVLVTYKTRNSPESLTTTVLQDAEILAAGQRMQPDPSGRAASATVVTLLLTPVEAERAVLASTQGTVHFVLRNGVDRDQTESTPISLSQMGIVAAASAPDAVPVDPETTGQPEGVRPARQRRHRGVETVLGGDPPEEGRHP